jgi:eukaryotic-like serine/threonine-protein kinase
MPLEKLGPYKLEKVLGRGGMGAVYAGVHQETGERAAVKVLSGHLADDEAFRERFKIEVETLKRLSHPGIVQLFGFGEDDGHLFFVMELVDGKSLHDELAAGRRFSWREVTRIGIEVAQALKHAHDRGIIHRDLKPANLLIDAQEHVKLTDFGIAKLYGGTSVTVDGGVLGTADYMAPEQADGKPVNSRCDLYSLGSVLYALLVGRPPFTGKTVIQVIAALKHEKPVPVRRLAPDTPAELEDIVLQLLDKDPQKRIPTALALANRLKAMEHALSVETRVVDPENDEGDELRLAPEPPPASGAPAAGSPAPKSALTQPVRHTVAIPSHQPTVPLPTLAGDGPSGGKATKVTGAGSAPRSQSATLATGAGPRGGSIHSAGTLVEGDRNEPAVEEPKTHFTQVARRDRPQDDDSRISWQVWLAAGVLLLAAIGIFASLALYGSRTPSADTLFARLQEAADSGGGSEFNKVERDLETFLTEYADDERAGEVASWRLELERYRLQQSSQRQAKSVRAEEVQTPAERAYLEAVRLAATDPPQALARFQAIVALYGGEDDPALSKLEQKAVADSVALAKQQITALEATAERLQTEERMAIRKQLERAAGLAAKDPAAAQSIRQAVITLYADKPWAADLIDEARLALAADQR